MLPANNSGVQAGKLQAKLQELQLHSKIFVLTCEPAEAEGP